MDEWFEVEVFTPDALGRIATTLTVHGGAVVETRRFSSKDEAKRAAEEMFPGRTFRIFRVTKDGGEDPA